MGSGTELSDWHSCHLGECLEREGKKASLLRESVFLGGNQRELARQKNMKKQSDSGKGKRRDDGLSAAARKQRDSEIMQQKQKKANEKKEEPK
uniref:Small EDRK-rich factor 2 n=1 Tax=Monodelphis domestica TaxID=13616 RepID=F7E532_MONDO